MLNKKYIYTDHLRVINSNFTDYLDESVSCNLYDKIRTLISRILIKLHYLTAGLQFRFFYKESAIGQECTRKGGGLTGNYQWVRLLEIAKVVKYFNIKSCCEFGSGGSTVLFSNLIEGDFYTFDESEKWLCKTKSCIPNQDNVVFNRCDRIESKVDDEFCTHYNVQSDFYTKYFDLVYIDGPTSTPRTKVQQELLDKTKIRMPNIDIEYFFKNGVFPKVILVDGRRSAVRRLLLNYSDKYDAYLRHYYDNKYSRYSQFLYHTIFVRKT